MRVPDKFVRDDLQQLLFNLQDVFARCESRSVRDSKNVSIHCHSRFAKGGVEYNIGGLPADPGQCF